jgi:hypothetical protein
MENVTIEFRGIEFDVEFDYQPFEPPERGPEAQYPGCDECIESVNSFTHQGTDFLELIYMNNESEIDELLLSSRHD